MAVVNVPTVTAMALATVDMFFGSLTPTASMICISLMEISLKLPVISARFSISSTSLNSITSRSLKSLSLSKPHHPPHRLLLDSGHSITYFRRGCNGFGRSGNGFGKDRLPAEITVDTAHFLFYA